MNVFQRVDPRANDRFNGHNSTIDPVAGHILGAINPPFGDNLEADVLFKSKEKLQQAWHTLKASKDGCIYYCGASVIACHTVLALNYAGLKATPKSS